mmetsp:Transcript_15864/g.44468  ORF Transcript_15864/g.44468 Transcript_15864/m.44468 type:complete len:235 (-) Transcript_15864:797-1501(-)
MQTASMSCSSCFCHAMSMSLRRSMIFLFSSSSNFSSCRRKIAAGLSYSVLSWIARDSNSLAFDSMLSSNASSLACFSRRFRSSSSSSSSTSSLLLSSFSLESSDELRASGSSIGNARKISMFIFLLFTSGMTRFLTISFSYFSNTMLSGWFSLNVALNATTEVRCEPKGAPEKQFSFLRVDNPLYREGTFRSIPKCLLTLFTSGRRAMIRWEGSSLSRSLARESPGCCLHVRKV